MFRVFFIDTVTNDTTNICISKYLSRTMLNTIANYASVKSLMERVNSVNTVRVRVPSGSRVLRKYLLSLYLLIFFSHYLFPYLYICSFYF